MQLRTNLHVSFPVSIRYDASPINMDDGVIYAAVVLLSLYVMVIFEVSVVRLGTWRVVCLFAADLKVVSVLPQVVHRALAAMIASTMSVAILAALNEVGALNLQSPYPLFKWIDAIPWYFKYLTSLVVDMSHCSSDPPWPLWLAGSTWRLCSCSSR